MSKYIKQDDIFELVRTGRLVGNSNFESVCKAVGSLPKIEVSEDCISRAYAIEVLSHVKKDEQWRTECIDNEIRLIKLLPSVVPSRAEGEWINQEQGAFYPVECSNCHKQPLLNEDEDYEYTKYCPNCGSRMKGVDNE